MPKLLITPDIPYRKYSRKEINNQPDISSADRLLLCLMHEYDRGDSRACFARNCKLADELGTTEASVRNRVSRLHQKGYIYTIGTERHGIANRRVRLKYGVKVDMPGAYTDIKTNGRPCRIKRKTGDVNPIIFLLNDEKAPFSPMRRHPSHNSENQSVIQGDLTKAPVSFSAPDGSEKDSQSFNPFSQTSSVVADDVTTDTRAKADVTPVTTTAPNQTTYPDDNDQTTTPVAAPESTTTPVTADDLDKHAGRKGKPWLEAAANHQGFKLICRKFGVTNPDKATARAFMKRVKNHSQTFNELTIGFVIKNLSRLSAYPECGVKVPTTMGEFMLNFNAIATLLLKSEIPKIKQALAQEQDNFESGKYDPLTTGASFRNVQRHYGIKTFREFYELCQTDSLSRPLLWFAAMVFVAEGEMSVTEDPQTQNEVIKQIITTPELVNALPPQLETATGCSAKMLAGMRTAILNQLQDCRSVFDEMPTVERALVLRYELPDFMDEQIDSYVASQTVRDLAGELQGQAA